jgi:hypothetical protein
MGTEQHGQVCRNFQNRAPDTCIFIDSFTLKLKKKRYKSLAVSRECSGL